MGKGEKGAIMTSSLISVQFINVSDEIAPARRTYNPSTSAAGDTSAIASKGRLVLVNGSLPAEQSQTTANPSELFSHRNMTYNENSIALSSDRGTLELSGVNLMYEGTRVKSWLVGRDMNPAGRGDGSHYALGDFTIGSIRPVPTTTPVGGWGNSVNNQCGTLGGNGCGLAPPNGDGYSGSGDDGPMGEGGDGSSIGGYGGLWNKLIEEYCGKLADLAFACWVICTLKCDIDNFHDIACCYEFDSEESFLSHLRDCLVCPDDVLKALAWCWAIKCGWDDAECCAFKVDKYIHKLVCSWAGWSGIWYYSHYCSFSCEVKAVSMSPLMPCDNVPEDAIAVNAGFVASGSFDNCSQWSGYKEAVSIGGVGVSVTLSRAECTAHCGTESSFAGDKLRHSIRARKCGDPHYGM